tara:strand:- start:101995 stop:102726 length:732 start_codon:yes stop_codon:yes gene_type:complete
MKKIKVLFSLVIFLALPSISYAELEDWGFRPNLGFDVQARTQNFETGYGDKHFSHRYPDVNFYIGTYMHKYLGFEVGYEYMFQQDKNSFYNTPMPALGFLNAVAQDSSYISHVSMQGPHFDVKGYWAVLKKTEIEFSLGLAWLKAQYQTMLFQDGGNAANRPTIWKSDRRSVLRLGLGCKHMLSEHFGARLQYVWSNTSKLDTTIPVGVDVGGVAIPVSMSHNFTTKPKNSHLVGLGFYYQAT